MNYDEHIERGKLTVAINEIRVAAYDILPGMCKVPLRGEELQVMDDSVQAVETAPGRGLLGP